VAVIAEAIAAIPQLLFASCWITMSDVQKGSNKRFSVSFAHRKSTSTGAKEKDMRIK